MKRAVFTLNDDKKTKFISALTGDLLIVYFPSSESVLPDIECTSISTDSLKQTIPFLDFQSKINPDTTLVFLDCMRYSKWNATVYNKMYKLSENAQKIVVIDSFPFVFDRRNIFITMKLLGISEYHDKQFYDDGFYIESNGQKLRANSIDATYQLLKDYIFCDTQPIQYTVHEWSESEIERENYDKFKHKVIFEDKLSKMKVVTWLMGTTNRMESKQAALSKIISPIKNQKPVVVYNWDRGIQEGLKRFGDCIAPTSYHQTDEQSSTHVIFMETVIAQRIMLYKKIQEHKNAHFHFLINYGIGADRLVGNQVIESVKDLNEFYEKAWQSI